jgi:hypothetical protein
MLFAYLRYPRLCRYTIIAVRAASSTPCNSLSFANFSSASIHASDNSMLIVFHGIKYPSLPSLPALPVLRLFPSGSGMRYEVVNVQCGPVIVQADGMGKFTCFTLYGCWWRDVVAPAGRYFHLIRTAALCFWCAPLLAYLEQPRRLWRFYHDITSTWDEPVRMSKDVRSGVRYAPTGLLGLLICPFVS